MGESASGTSLPRVESDEFAGPLDLLLDEVRRQHVAIERIAMAPVVARFLDYMRTAAARNLNLHIDWLHMAATLIQWKSRSLLPHEAHSQVGVDPIRDDLVRQLLAHRRRAAGELERRQTLENNQFSRFSGDRLPEPAAAAFVSVWDLIQQAREMALWAEAQRQRPGSLREALEIEPDDVSIAEMVEYLRRSLAGGCVPFDGLAFFENEPSPSRRSCLFLAMLEMARDQELTIEQNESFGAIWLKQRTRAS